MKKQVVAVVLSLAMCASTGAEASIVSAAEFSSEVSEADLSAETEELADESDSEDLDVADDSVETVDTEDASGDAAQTEDTVDGDNGEAVDDQTTVDLNAGDESDAVVFSDEIQPEESVAQETGVTETVGDHEARLSYTRWVPDDAKNPTKWKLIKPASAKTQEAQNTEAAAVGTEETTTENTEDAAAVDEAYTIDAAEETAGEAEAQQTETEAVADEQQADAELQPAEVETQDAGASTSYYTAADGLVKIATLNKDGSEIFTAYYAFDKDGYLLTGRSQVGSNTTDYYYFLTSGEVSTVNKLNDTQNASAKTPYNSKLGQMIDKQWRWNAKDGVFNYYAPKQETITVGIHKINGESYYLQKTGKPFVGDLTISGYVYYFRPAASANDIPGKMARNGWVSKGKQWRYFDANGRYQKKGVGAYKLLSNSNNLYLLNANGYLITNKKMTKGADGYYYLANGSGVVYRDKLVKYGKYRYYFVSNGRRATWKKRWVRLAGAGKRYYYFGSVAGRVQEQKGIKKVTVNGKFVGWFYFSPAGNSYLNAWKSGRYYLSDGRMASGVTKIGNKYYFFQRSSSKAYKGKVYKGKWIKYNNKYYYASGSGVLAESGWKWILADGRKYYFLFENCTAVTNKTGVKHGDTYGSLDSRGRFISAGWVVVSNSKNYIRYMNPKTGKYVKNTTMYIDGLQYRFDSRGYRVNDRTNEFKRSKYYLICDRVNGVMTVYADKNKTIPIKSIRVSVGKAETPTKLGTFTLTRSDRWQLLMGPSWGQYGTHVTGGIYVHSVACSQKNDHNLPVAEYYRLGTPASHGCIRCCVADAKWVYDNCNGSQIKVVDGTYTRDETRKGPLGRRALTPLRGSKNFDPTDPAYN